MAAAQADLAGIRERLVAARKGDTTTGVDLIASLKGYLDTHGPALQAAAASVGEEVRRQALAELYKWRTQIATQLHTNEKPSPAPADET